MKTIFCYQVFLACICLLAWHPSSEVSAQYDARDATNDKKKKEKKGVKKSNLRKHKNKKTPNPKIVNGVMAKPLQYPFFVQGAGCGGVLIAKDGMSRTQRWSMYPSTDFVCFANTFFCWFLFYITSRVVGSALPGNYERESSGRRSLRK